MEDTKIRELLEEFRIHDNRMHNRMIIMDKYTVKERFAYLPCILVWDVPAINGRYYRFIWWKKFYTIQKNNRWMLVHTYAKRFTAEQRCLNLNAGLKYRNVSFS